MGLRLTTAATDTAGTEGFVSDVQKLLSKYYVEDADGDFRFNLSKEYLTWMLLGPGTDPRCLCGIRESVSGELVAFAATVPISMWDGVKVGRVAYLDYVCVHRKFRGNRLCPFLVRDRLGRNTHIHARDAHSTQSPTHTDASY